MAWKRKRTYTARKKGGFKRRRWGVFGRGYRRAFKRRGGAVKTFVPNLLTSDCIYVKLRLRHGRTISKTGSTNGWLGRVLVLNDLQKPVVNDTVFPPTGYPWYSQMFSTSVVLGAKVKATAVVVTSVNPPLNFVMIPSTDGTAWPGNADPAEQPYCKRTILPANTSEARVLKSYVSVAKMHGVSKQEVKDDVDAFGQWTSGTGHTPLKPLYMFIMFNNLPDTSVADWDAYLSFEVTYYVKFMRRTVETYSAVPGVDLESDGDEDGE